MAVLDTEHGLSPSEPGDRFVAVLVRIAKVYWYLFVVFLLASLAAVLAWFLGAAIREFLWTQWPVQVVQYVAWVAGATFAAIGQAMGWVSVNFPQRQQPPTEPTTSEALETSALPANRPLIRTMRTSLVFGFFGIVFGMMLGGFNASIFISIALSPFAPREWTPEDWGGTSNGTAFGVITLIIAGGTVVVLGSLGLLLGGVGSLMGWATETPISEARKRYLRAEFAELQQRGP